MLMPKRTKFRKTMKGRMRGTAFRGSKVSFGDYGLQAIEAGWIKSRQIEAARVAITRRIIEAHNGTIRIAPHPDGGTQVTLELPIEGEEEA